MKLTFCAACGSTWLPDLSDGSHAAGSRPAAEPALAASWGLPRAASRCPSCAERSPLRAPRLNALRRLWALEVSARRGGLARQAGQG
jgi:hypothetical protein